MCIFEAISRDAADIGICYRCFYNDLRHCSEKYAGLCGRDLAKVIPLDIQFIMRKWEFDVSQGN